MRPEILFNCTSLVTVYEKQDSCVIRAIINAWLYYIQLVLGLRETAG